MEDITKEDFNVYKAVQESGMTNMFDISVVMELSGLERNKVLTIMKHYNDLTEKYYGKD
tara:strand:+ start:101 stop:277 length:177 start_codon:yes stop_codon:yes gene_type:complete